jgi:glycine cleavage system H protein
MSEVPNEFKYTKSHEWIEMQADGTAVVGITDHAQELLGDLVFVEVPETGSAVSQGDACAVVESVKAASDVYAPLSGEVIAANEDLADAPETINQHPHTDGWLFKISMSDEAELEELLSPDEYKELIESED